MTWVAIAIAFFVATMERWSVAEVSEFLVVNGFDEDAVELFRRNKIRGKVLKLLTDRDLQEMGLSFSNSCVLVSFPFNHNQDSTARCHIDSYCDLYNYYWQAHAF